MTSKRQTTSSQNSTSKPQTWLEIIEQEENQKKQASSPSSNRFALLAQKTTSELAKKLYIPEAKYSTQVVPFKDKKGEAIIPQASKQPAIQYFDKKILQSIILIEDEFSSLDPKTVAQYIFPKGWHYQPRDPYKTQA